MYFFLCGTYRVETLHLPAGNWSLNSINWELCWWEPCISTCYLQCPLCLVNIRTGWGMNGCTSRDSGQTGVWLCDSADSSGGMDSWVSLSGTDPSLEMTFLTRRWFSFQKVVHLYILGGVSGYSTQSCLMGKWSIEVLLPPCVIVSPFCPWGVGPVISASVGYCFWMCLRYTTPREDSELCVCSELLTHSEFSNLSHSHTLVWPESPLWPEDNCFLGGTVVRTDPDSSFLSKDLEGEQKPSLTSLPGLCKHPILYFSPTTHDDSLASHWC